jgi:ABC-type cobalamin/Fe3+-siderophores transport system ATPase subunit
MSRSICVDYFAYNSKSLDTDVLVSYNVIIPQSTGESLNLNLNEGDIFFILGANGTGKSSLMQRLYSNNTGNARRISAHRQTWFSSNEITLLPEQKRSTENNIQYSDTNLDSRWKDDYASQRTNISICDLIDAENLLAHAIAVEVRNDNIDLAKNLANKDAPIKIINELLRLSNIPVEISIQQNNRVMASKSGSDLYSISKLSDGERNALLIATDVLTAKPNTLFLIDEPERHLHRSIISPLLTCLFAKRADCSFIVSTHDVLLPLDNPGSQTLLIRGCTYVDDSVSSWDIDRIITNNEFDDNLKKDILGARRELLFVEGKEGQSLDKPLYSLVFPNVSVVAKSGCRDVEHAVSSIRDADDLHWLRAFGIVDNDRRTQEDINKLRQKGVYAVSVFSVESIYYHPKIQKLVTERLVKVVGGNVDELINRANTALITAITPHIQQLSERAVEKNLREEMFRHLPRRQDIATANPINVTINVSDVVKTERDRLENAISTGDSTQIIGQYPIRETPALNKISKELGFQNRDQYEGAVRKLLMDDPIALSFVRSLFGTLESDINAI